MTREEVEEVVRVTLSIAKSHWILHGTPLRPEDAIYVASDVMKSVTITDRTAEQQTKPPHEREPPHCPTCDCGAGNQTVAQ